MPDTRTPGSHTPKPDARGSAPEPLSGLYGKEHPLVDIPFTAFLDGRQYRGYGLNLVEAHVTGLADPSLDGDTRQVRLAFSFQGFEVALTPQVHIWRTSERDLELRFADPSGEHLPQLRHLINEWIAGDLTSLGSVIRTDALAGPDKPSKGRGTVGWGATLRTLAGSVAALALTAGLIFVAGTLVQDRLFVNALPEPGRIAPEGRVLRAVTDGQLSFLDTGAAQGEVAFAIAGTGGETLSIGMPCDCAGSTPLEEGATVLAGDPVMRLAEDGAPLVVEASMPAEALLELQHGGAAWLELPGGEAVRATPDLTRAAVALGDGPVPVTLRPNTPLPDAAAGGLVSIRIERSASAALGPLAGLWTRAADTARIGADGATDWWQAEIAPRLGWATAAMTAEAADETADASDTTDAEEFLE